MNTEILERGKGRFLVRENALLICQVIQEKRRRARRESEATVTFPVDQAQ